MPPDLATAWLVTPRPEGTRCVVVAARGATSARRRDGSPLVPHFPSQLPAGSASTAEAVESVTILDCILHAVRMAGAWDVGNIDPCAELKCPLTAALAPGGPHVLHPGRHVLAGLQPVSARPLTHVRVAASHNLA